MTKIKIIVSILFFTMPYFFAKGQVTIGANHKPQEGVLLEISDKVRDATGVTATKGGVILPCVELLAENTLEPFIKTTDNEWIDPNSNIKSRHSGLVVYNLNTSFIKGKGLYVWNGEKWISYKSVNATNGVTLASDGRLKLGGYLIENTDLDLSSNTLAIDANNKAGFILSNLDPGINAFPLAVSNDGTVGIRSQTASKAKVAFIQSTSTYEIKDPLIGTGELTQLNNGTGVVVPWNSKDIIVNTRGGNLPLVTFSGNTFTIQEKATIEVSGHLVYLASGEINNGGIILPWGRGPLYLDGKIQVKRSNSTIWTDVSSNRLIIPDNKERDGKFRQFMNLPSALLDVNKGDQLRILIKNAADPKKYRHTGVGFISLTENYSNPMLAVPRGTTISRSFKILVHN